LGGLIISDNDYYEKTVEVREHTRSRPRKKGEYDPSKAQKSKKRRRSRREIRY
jgi:hypothetical protein